MPRIKYLQISAVDTQVLISYDDAGLGDKPHTCKGSISSQVIFNVFTNDIDSGIKSTLSTFPINSKLSDELDTFEGWGAIQRIWTSSQSGPCEPHEFQQDQVPAYGSEQSPV
ncbi:hypothetical protein WISP_128840 [Willisornis vidua]|uniref:Uncharacterized protein n=1 Tax=Willisornis vidua TaxID=1566151 RepID=A0ABQ9CQC4_9PASS|nr:hypothetical protein WISP_128840 [Willisornis vidua]